LNPSDRYPVIIDIATGKTYRILEPLLTDNYFSSPFPSSDGRTLVMTGDNQDCSTSFNGYYGSCIFVARLGEPIEMLNPMYINSPARISPNGEMIGARGQLLNSSTSTFGLKLMTLEGQLLQTVGDFHMNTFTWLPDGRLMFVWDRTIYLTDSPYDLNATAIYTAEGDKGVRELSPSHDGTRVAFSLRYDTNSHYIMVMNIDGSGLRQLTDNPPGDVDPSQYFPVWSPDDQWIMVENNGNMDKTMYAVRVDANKVILDDDQFTPGEAIKIQSDLHDHLSTAGASSMQTAWLSVAPFLDASARSLLDNSESSSLPQNFNGEWTGPCQKESSNSSIVTLKFNHDQCTEIEQLFRDSNCSELVSESEKSTNCHLGETLITDSGLTATTLVLEDGSILEGENLVYQDGNLLYLGQGNALDLEAPYTRSTKNNH
jgi:hypothetical protein